MAASSKGHNGVQGLQKYLGGLRLVVFGIIGVVFALKGQAPLAVQHSVSLSTFVLAVGILVSFNLSWASYSSDYTRYLPARSSPSRVVLLALCGLLSSAIPFQILALISAGSVADASPTAVIASLQQAMRP